MKQGLVDAILDAPLAGRPWAPLFPALTSIAGQMSCMIKFAPAGFPLATIVKTSMDDHPDDLPDLYRSAYQYKDPINYYGLSPLQLYSLDDLIDRAQLRRSDFHRDVLEPNRMFHAFVCYLGRFDRTDVWIKGIQANPFSSAEWQALEEATPFVAMAARYYCRLQRQCATSLVFSEALDAIGLGVIVVDRNGLILDMNGQAVEMLARGGNLGRAGDRLMLPTAASKALSAILQDPEGRGSDASSFLCHGADGDVHIAVRVPNNAGALDHSEAGAIISLRKDGVVASDNAIRFLQRRFGLTPCEARFALALANGHSINEAAELLDVTVKTARTYSKRIYIKTDTNRQSELVRLITSQLFFGV